MYLKSPGIIISSVNSKDSDRIYRVYTEEFGKILCIGKGVRNLKSRRSPQLDTLNLVKFGLNKRDEFYYIESASLVNDFKRIKLNLTVTSWSLYLLESLSLLTEEADPQLYFKLVDTLTLLNSKPSKRIVYSFLKELILRQGYWDYEYENDRPYLKFVDSALPPNEIDQRKIDIFFNSLLEKLSERRINTLLLLKNL